MGSAADTLGHGSQQLQQTVSAIASGTGTASFVFPSPPGGSTWTGTLSVSCNLVGASVPTGAIFTATIGATAWGSWGGSSVYGPVQAIGNGAQQLIVTATGLTAGVSYVITWVGSNDVSSRVAAVWPDANSTALTATISGTVGLTAGTTVAVSGGSVSTVTATTKINATGLTLSSTTITVVSTANFPTSGFITVLAGGSGTIIATVSYTGVTSTSFTGCTTVSQTGGGSSSTIPNNLPVVQANVGTASTTLSSGTSVGLSSGTTVGLTSGTSVLANPATTTTTGSTLPGASSIQVSSTAGFPSAGFVSIPQLSGGPAIYSYNGTDGSDFLGCTFVSGNALSSCASGAPVIPAQVTSGSVTNNPNAAQIDQILTSSGSTFTTTFLSIYNAAVSVSYSSFMVIFGGYGAIPTQQITVSLANASTGESWVLTQMGTGQTTPAQFNFPIAVTAGQVLSVSVSASPTLTDEWQIIGFRDQHRVSLANNALDTLHTNEYGGKSFAYTTGVVQASTLLLAAPPTGYGYRLHSWTITAPPTAGQIRLWSNSAAGGSFATFFTGTTAGFQYLGGLLTTQALYLIGPSLAPLTISCHVFYDLVQIPQIL